MEEVEEDSSNNNGDEREAEDNSNSKKDDGNEEVENFFNSGDNSVDNAQTQSSARNAMKIEITHVSTSFSLKPITFCKERSKMDNSPITISSPAKDNSKVSSKPRVL